MIHFTWYPRGDPSRMVDGFCAVQANQRYFALDAFDQDVTGGGGSLSDLAFVRRI